MTKFKVNQEVCIGCGTCVSLCPECFELNDEGKSQVILDECKSDCDSAEVVSDCPVRAISIE